MKDKLVNVVFFRENDVWTDSSTQKAVNQEYGYDADNKQYTYRTILKLKVGDFAVVQVADKYEVVKVVQTKDVVFKGTERYRDVSDLKWIVARVDVKLHKAQLAAYKKAERLRAELAAQIQEHYFFDDAEEVGQINAKVRKKLNKYRKVCKEWGFE